MTKKSDPNLLSPFNSTSQSGDDVWRPGGGADRDNDDENGATNDDGWGATANENNDDADGKWLGFSACCRGRLVLASGAHELLFNERWMGFERKFERRVGFFDRGERR
jgi:hypothetical protein